MAKILYVEDDKNLSFVTKDNLEDNGFEVNHFYNGKDAWKSFEKEKYDLALIDINLPIMDGFSLTEKIRSQNQDIPVIFLTAKKMQEDIIEGLKIGGDDYITKPFSMEELILRLNIFLKRKNKVNHDEEKDEYNIGDYKFSFSQLKLFKDGKEQKMTHREAEVLRYLAEKINEVSKREDILVSVWGRDDYFLGRSLDVFITRLRKLLKDDPNIEIENIHGIGFRMNVK